MRKGKTFSLLLAGFFSGTILAAIIYRLSAKTKQNRLLRKVDVFAEPLTEKLNELFDSIAVAYDLLIEAVTAILPHTKANSVKIEKRAKTTPGRYVTVKN